MCFFIPEAIIGKSVKYNVVSDAAHKFERGVDVEAQENVLRRFIQIVKDHTSIKRLDFNHLRASRPRKKAYQLM